MKNRQALIQISILAVLGIALILTLVLPDLPATQVQRSTVGISLFLREGDISLSSNTRLGMEAAALDYGAELRFVTPPSAESHQNQMTLIQREIEGGADALIISPIDPIGLTQSLEQGEISLPVITMESMVEGAVLCTTPDNELMGRELAQAVLADSDSGTILLIDTADTRTGVRQRMDACYTALQEAGCAVVFVSLDALLSHMDLSTISAIVAPDYQTTLAIASWESTQSIHHQLYGVGGTTEIAAYLERGTLQATVTWSEYAIGYLTVQRAVSAAMGLVVEEIPTHTITTIRGRNIYDPDNQKLLFPVV